MKKSLIALAVLAASGAAMAQSSVTLYGVADAGVTYLNGKDNWSGVTSGNNLTSRVGFRGVEDLGGGLKANFNLEGGFNLDNGDGASGYAGATAGAGFQFKRRSTVGLAGSFGEVRLGRELTAAYNATARYDVFGSVGLAQSRLWADGGVVDANANVTSVTTNQRISNAVTYVSPDFSGFKVGVNYGFGEVAGGNTKSGYMGAGLMYDNGPLSLGLALERLKSGANSVATGDVDAWSLGGSYDLGVAKLLAGYRESKVDLAAGENKRLGYYLAATAPVGPGLVRASYNRYENKLNGTKLKADQFGLGYVYSLSKRTSVYGTYAYLKNKDGASLYTLGSGGLKSNGSQQGVQVGVSHAF
jgi:predicted porin